MTLVVTLTIKLHLNLLNQTTVICMNHQGEAIKIGIRGKGLSQQQAAERLGIARQTLAGYLNRHQLPNELISDVMTKLGIVIPNSNDSTVSENETSYGAPHQPTTTGAIPTTTTLHETQTLLELLEQKDKLIQQQQKIIEQQTALIEKAIQIPDPDYVQPAPKKITGTGAGA